VRARSTTGSWKTTLLALRAASGSRDVKARHCALPLVGAIGREHADRGRFARSAGAEEADTSDSDLVALLFTALTPAYVFRSWCTSSRAADSWNDFRSRLHGSLLFRWKASHLAPLVRHTYDGTQRKDVTVNEQSWQLEQFERYRPHLQAVAYRMLGSVTEADDALQEAWLRLSRAKNDDVANLGGWLTTVVGRVCLDMLRARRSRQEDYVGSWLPEPIVSRMTNQPEQEASSPTRSVSRPVVLETLTPRNARPRAARHVCSTVRGSRSIVGRTPAAARQLASRGRRRVRGAAPNPDTDVRGQREIVDAFLAAAREGDFDALLAVLDPDVVFRADPGKIRALERLPITGAEAVAAEILSRGSRFARPR
jgi:RNA polymerase sigma-70 factor (ECF subfamily)